MSGRRRRKVHFVLRPGVVLWLKIVSMVYGVAAVAFFLTTESPLEANYRLTFGVVSPLVWCVITSLLSIAALVVLCWREPWFVRFTIASHVVTMVTFMSSHFYAAVAWDKPVALINGSLWLACALNGMWLLTRPLVSAHLDDSSEMAS